MTNSSDSNKKGKKNRGSQQHDHANNTTMMTTPLKHSNISNPHHSSRSVQPNTIRAQHQSPPPPPTDLLLLLQRAAERKGTAVKVTDDNRLNLAVTRKSLPHTPIKKPNSSQPAPSSSPRREFGQSGLYAGAGFDRSPAANTLPIPTLASAGKRSTTMDSSPMKSPPLAKSAPGKSFTSQKDPPRLPKDTYSMPASPLKKATGIGSSGDPETLEEMTLQVRSLLRLS